MKRILLFIFIFLSFIQCKNKFIEGPSDDKGRYECECNEKGRDGICNFYDSLNNFKGFVNYKNDTAEGEFKSYYEDGKLESEGFYHKNKIIKSFEYDKNGVINIECLAKDNWVVFKYYKSLKIFNKRYNHWIQAAQNMETDSILYYDEDGNVIYKYSPPHMYKCENDSCYEVPLIGNNEGDFVEKIWGKKTEDIYYFPDPIPKVPWFY